MKNFSMFLRDFHRELRKVSSIGSIASASQYAEISAIGSIAQFVLNDLGVTLDDPWMKSDMGYCGQDISNLLHHAHDGYGNTSYPYQHETGLIEGILKGIHDIAADEGSDSKEHAALVFTAARSYIMQCFALASNRPEYYAKIKYILLNNLIFALLPTRVLSPIFSKDAFRDLAKNLIVGFMLINATVGFE
jgi:hypothetical protein